MSDDIKVDVVSPARNDAGGGEGAAQRPYTAADYGDGLKYGHGQMLPDSAIAPEVARERGYKTVESKAELATLGFKAWQRRVPALLVPVHGVSGEVVNYQIRPDRPRIGKNGKAIKYETVADSSMAIDVPPRVRDKLGNPDVPLFITEGARKADSAVSQGLCCIALLGVWNWRGTNAHGGKAALPDWETVALNGRTVYLSFDSDVMEKPAVYHALARLKGFLESRGAKVRVVYLDGGEDGAKVGLDDFFAAGRTVDDLLALATTELRAPPKDHEDRAGPYFVRDGCILMEKPSKDGPVVVPLTNFDARIVADIVQDDGAEGEERRELEIEAVYSGRTHRFTVPASRFAGMSWVIEHLGPSAVVQPGVTLKDHARAAVQLLSGAVVERRIYTHTGWRHVGGMWAYLHAGGPLGPDGPVDGVDVSLRHELHRYRLPSLEDGTEATSEGAVADAVRASLRLVELGPDLVTLPLYSAIWRAVLGEADFSVFLVGPTGVFKSELAALAQQHYGAGMDRLHLPANWSSTENSLEGLAFLVKDALLVVDDFAPTGSRSDVDRMHARAERLLRARGNRSGRGRMRPDGTLRATRYPRGIVLSSGEDVPRGLSLLARMVVLQVEPGAVESGALTACQQDAREGRYALAMAAFLRWLAPRYGDLRAGSLAKERERLRQAAVDAGQHRRTPGIVADLSLGLRFFLHFAVDAGALEREEADTIWRRAWTAFGHVATQQTPHLVASEPTRRFLDLLGAAVASGRVHLAGPDGSAPKPNPEAYGWERLVAGVEVAYRPKGDRVGWIDGDKLFLGPDAAYAVAQRLGRDGDVGLSISQTTLHKRLHEKGLLVETELQSRQTYTKRVELEGRRRSVLYMRADVLSAPEEGERTSAGSTACVPSLWSDESDHPTTDPTSASDGAAGTFAAVDGLVGSGEGKGEGAQDARAGAGPAAASGRSAAERDVDGAGGAPSMPPPAEEARPIAVAPDFEEFLREEGHDG